MQQALVDQAKRGDREAFDALARTVGDKCMAIALRILRDTDRADDAVQAALIVAWRELRTLRDAERFQPRLHRILGFSGKRVELTTPAGEGAFCDGGRFHYWSDPEPDEDISGLYGIWNHTDVVYAVTVDGNPAHRAGCASATCLTAPRARSQRRFANLCRPWKS